MENSWWKKHFGRTSHQSKSHFTSVRLTFLLWALFPLCFTWRQNQIKPRLQNPCLIFMRKMSAQLRPQSNSDEKAYTDNKKPRGTTLHLLVNHTQNKQITMFRTYRPSCCCGSPCHACQWCPWMKRGRGPFRLSHSLWAQCLTGTRRPHLKGGKKLNTISEL